MRKRSIFSSLSSWIMALSFCTALLVTGCAPGSIGGGSTLKITAFDTIDVQLLKEVAKIYEKKHSGVKVQVTLIPEDQYVTKFDTAALAQNLPDIAYVYTKRWLKANYFVSLDSALEERDVDLSTYNQGILKTHCTHEGKLYCVGGYSGAVVLYYNKDLFQQAGLPFLSTTQPISFDEYASLAKKLAKPDKDPAKTIWGADVSVPYWYGDPAAYLDESGRKIQATNPAFVHTIDVLSSMVREGISPSGSAMANMGGIGATDLFAQNKLAMHVIDNVMLERFDAQNINYGIAPTPVQAGQQPWVSSWTNNYGVTSKSKLQKEALDFLALFATEAQRLEAEKFDVLPLDTAAAEKYNWVGDKQPRKELVEVVNLARPGIFMPEPFSWVGPLDDAFSEIIDGKKTTEQALKDALPKLQQGIDASWRSWDAIK